MSMYYVMFANSQPYEVLPPGTDAATAQRWLAFQRRKFPHSNITMETFDAPPDGVPVLSELIW